MKRALREERRSTFAITILDEVFSRILPTTFMLYKRDRSVRLRNARSENRRASGHASLLFSYSIADSNSILSLLAVCGDSSGLMNRDPDRALRFLSASNNLAIGNNERDNALS